MPPNPSPTSANIDPNHEAPHGDSRLSETLLDGSIPRLPVRRRPPLPASCPSSCKPSSSGLAPRTFGELPSLRELACQGRDRGNPSSLRRSRVCFLASDLARL